MSSTDELIQNVIDTIDNASSQKHGLTEQLQSLKLAQEQVQHSAEVATDEVKRHFESLQKVLSDSLEARMSEMIAEIGVTERCHLEPLHQCEDMINMSLTDATTCLAEGRGVLEDGPENNVAALLKFKEASLCKDLHVLPEVPCLSDVAFLGVDFHNGLTEKFHELVAEEGRIYDRAPVQITEVEERPGALLVKWAEVDDDIEIQEFCLQFCYGQTTAWDSKKSTFHAAYTGPYTSHLVRRLRTNTPYSFRVNCRSDQRWSVWSIPRVAVTHITQYQWDETTEGYTVNYEQTMGTRCSGLTRVLYSSTQCYKAGFPISFRILDAGEKSPTDGIGITVTNDDMDTMKREGAVFLARDGTVFIDGQEMKTRLPCFSRKSCVTIETESLPNGKVRVSVQVEDKELTFDWKVDKLVTLGMIGGLGMTPLTESTQCFFFAMIFSHEDWKVSVE